MAVTASTPSFRPAIVHAIAVIGVVAIVLVSPLLNLADAHAYWAVPLGDLYGSAQAGAADAYLYAPPFAQVLTPLKALPWPVFAGIWLLLMALCLVRIAGPWALLLLLIPPVLIELQAGNIHLLLALAIGLGLRYPATWAVVALTKPTLGIGLLWFLVRGEWRQLGIALGATAAVSAVSIALAPGAWTEWIATLVANAGSEIRADYPGVIHIPLLVRLPLAAAIVVWGARADRRWTLAFATTLALPILWINGLTILLAVPLLEEWRAPQSRLSGFGRSLRNRGDARPGGDRDELAIREESDAASKQESGHV